jgi:hypothetical protein
LHPCRTWAVIQVQLCGTDEGWFLTPVRHAPCTAYEFKLIFAELGDIARDRCLVGGFWITVHLFLLVKLKAWLRLAARNRYAFLIIPLHSDTPVPLPQMQEDARLKLEYSDVSRSRDPA